MEDRLQKFVTLIDTGSFTKAAVTMHLSQPALSTAIKKLERELRAELIAHDNRHLRLTPAGELTYAAGKELITHRNNLEQRLVELSKHKIPLSVGMIDSIAETLFVHGRELDALEQWAHVSLSINNSALLIQSVLQHELDIAIITEQATIPKMLTVQTLGAEPLLIVARADMARRAQASIKQGILPNFLSYNQTSTTHHLLQAVASQNGVVLQPSFYSTSPDIILKLVLAGRGVGALPYLIVKEHCEHSVLAPIKLGRSPVIERHIAAVTHTNRHLPNAFEDTLTRTSQQLKTLLQEAKSI